MRRTINLIIIILLIISCSSTPEHDNEQIGETDLEAERSEKELKETKEKMRLAILDLQPEKVDKSTSKMVSGLLRTELLNTGLFRVIERGEMVSILKEHEFQMSGCTETECAVQVGKLLSARKILVGTLGKLGKKYIINARIVDVEKGEMEFGETVSVGSEEELEDAAGDFAFKLTERIQGKRYYAGKKYFKYFNDGVGYYNKGDYKKAIDYWNKIPKTWKHYNKAQKNINAAKKKYFNVGVAFYEKGDYKKAIDYWNKIPKTWKNYNKAQKNIDIAKKKISKIGKKESEKEIKHLKERTIGGIKFVYIKGGEFMMGSPDSGKGGSPEKPQHKVYVDSFWIGKYEVTLKEFSEFINTSGYRTDGDKNGYSLILTGKKKGNRFIMHDEKKEGVNWKCNTEGKEDYKERLNHPVISVSWNDAIAYCKWVSKKYNIKARLPYEAEWEYACRAGTTTKYYWGNKMDETYCWYGRNSGKKTHTVGQKKPNRWGLYDMSGNVAEWVMDWYKKDYYKKSLYKNPKGPSKEGKKVLRGGSWWVNPEKWLRSAVRICHPANVNYNFFGFRVVIAIR